MDPNATLDEIAALLITVEQGDPSAGEELDQCCQDLYDWLENGGFEPDWERHSLAASYYRYRAVVHARGERMVRYTNPLVF